MQAKVRMACRGLKGESAKTRDARRTLDFFGKFLIEEKRERGKLGSFGEKTET